MKYEDLLYGLVNDYREVWIKKTNSNKHNNYYFRYCCFVGLYNTFLIIYNSDTDLTKKYFKKVYNLYYDFLDNNKIDLKCLGVKRYEV